MKVTRLFLGMVTSLLSLGANQASSCEEKNYNQTIIKDLAIELMDKNAISRTEAETYVETLTETQRENLLRTYKNNSVKPASGTAMFVN